MKLQTLRPWQSECLVKARDWFIEREKDLFLINAAPGAGKTIAACAIAASLIDDGLVDREIGRAHVRTPVTEKSRMPSSA